MHRAFAHLALNLVFGLALGAPAAADGPEEISLCVTNTVPAPLPPGCFAADGEWSAAGAITGGGTEIDSCGHFNGIGVSVELGFTLFDDSGASLSVVNENILDWGNLGDCEVPDPNPCGLSCDNLYNARRGQWQFTGGTGAWEKIQGGGNMITLVTREYEVGTTCTSNQDCASNLCDRGTCFRRVGHAYFWGRAHFLKTP